MRDHRCDRDVKNHFGNMTGAFSDGAILFPLLAALVLQAGMNGAVLLASVGIAYIAAGFVFRVPMAVQPLKSVVVAALAIGARRSRWWGLAAPIALTPATFAIVFGATTATAGILAAVPIPGLREALIGIASCSTVLLWMLWQDRPALTAIARSWRISLAAGALGACASLFWFIGFALTSAANVRTVALVEVLFAQILSARLFREGTSLRKLAGITLIIGGVTLLIRIA